MDQVPPCAISTSQSRFTTGAYSMSPPESSAADGERVDRAPRSAPSLCKAPARTEVPLRGAPGMDIDSSPMWTVGG